MFIDAIVRGANFSHAHMGSTTLTGLDLRVVKGLDTIPHSGPSSIGIDTVYRSGGNISEAFLHEAGIPEPFIVHMKSLAAAMSPIEFYSCFISYSSKDQEFAEQLHSDLRGKNVRCWFAPEDLKIGDKLRPAFDEAIRVHDKLMVLLSGNSVGSPWVEKEVETAFEKERRQSRTVLFPIRLDEAVMETNQAWAADIRRTRHIGDFRDWKNHDSYKKAFERLLRDLKAV
jgi:TIR domain